MSLSSLLVRAHWRSRFFSRTDAYAATDADLAEIRDQIRQLKESYEARIQALEQRLKEAKRNPRPASPAAPAPSPPAPVAAAPARRRPPTSSTGGSAPSIPAISAVLQGVYTNLSQDPEPVCDRRLRAERRHRAGERGFCIAESELALTANVDDKFAGNLIFSLTPDNTVAVEEAYGLSRRRPTASRRSSDASSRASATSTTSTSTSGISTTRRSPYQAFLGGQFTNNGVQLKWVAPTDTSSSSAAKSATARAFPATDATRTASAAAPFTCTRAATSARATAGAPDSRICRPRPSDREYAQTDIAGNDAQVALFRQEPARDRRLRLEMGAQRQRAGAQFQAAGRVLLARENGDLTYDCDGALGLTQTVDYRVATRAASTCRASTSSCRTGASARATTGSIPAASTTARTALPRARRRSIRSARR